jgi:hypothetical protein
VFGWDRLKACAGGVGDVTVEQLGAVILAATAAGTSCRVNAEMGAAAPSAVEASAKSPCFGGSRQLGAGQPAAT